MTSPAATLPREPRPTAPWPRFDPRRSLRARAALTFFLVAFGAAVFAAWIGGVLLRRELQQRTGRLLETVAVDVGERAETGLHERLLDLQLTIASPALREPGRATDRRAAVDALLDGSPDFAWVGWADANGDIVAAAPHVFETQRVSARPWYRHGRLEPYIGNLQSVPELAQATSLPGVAESQFIDLAVPVIGPSGKPDAVVAAFVRGTWLESIVRSAVPESLRREHVTAAVYSSDGQPLVDVESPGWTAAPGMPVVPMNAPTRGAFVESLPDGGRYLTGYYRTHGTRGFRGMRWFVATRQPLADVMAPVQALRRTVVLIAIPAALAFAVLGWVLAMPLSRQLRRIAGTAARIESGDVLATLPSPEGDGEIARACRSLRALIDHLRGR